MSLPCATGLIRLPRIGDPAETHRRLRDLAESHGRELTSVVAYWPGEAWVLRMIETIHRDEATAVVALDMHDVADAQHAIASVADLITSTVTYPYVGYTTPGQR
jgi:hypothetical protein